MSLSLESSLDSDAGSTTTYCSTDAIVCVCLSRDLEKKLVQLDSFLGEAGVWHWFPTH